MQQPSHMYILMVSKYLVSRVFDIFDTLKFKLIIYLFPQEPIKVYGEATLAISSVKDMIVTDDFLGLDESARKCQNREAFENCTTRQYLETVKRQCNCVPYALNANSVRQF